MKDENGEVGFLLPSGSLARKVGAAKDYYNARAVAAKAHEAGVYLIGRVVVFEDPMLSAGRPDLAIQTSGGSVWQNNAGLGWANPYDRRVWDYNISVAAAAARAGFDEIQFDYVRFPSDGPIESAVFSHKVAEPMGWTITRFVHYASSRAQAARRARLGRRLRALGHARPRHRPVAGAAREVRGRGVPDGLPVALQLRASSTSPTRARSPAAPSRSRSATSEMR